MNLLLRAPLAAALLIAGTPVAFAADAHKAEPKAEAKAEAKHEARGEVKHDAKGTEKPEAKAAKPEPKAEPKPEPKPEPVHAARPAPRRSISPETRKRALAAAAVPHAEPAAPAHAEHPPHWSYEGKGGPHEWAKLAPEFAACGAGERQSPIDIRDGLKVDLEPIAFEYRPTSFKVVDNGHTIQVNVSGWNSMRLMGRQFRLVQFHFHRPSEEMIEGKQFEMVVHLVHKDAQDRLAVVAVLLEKGARQPVLQSVLNNLPLEKGMEVAVNATSIDLAQLLPVDRRYFTYMGSLTTPPCTENVMWIVMKQPVQATAEQMNLFARLYPMNARPIQEAKGRLIKESN